MRSSVTRESTARLVGLSAEAETVAVIPETLYARTSDDVWIAYQTLGDGPVDLILVSSWVSHLEIFWEQPRFVQMLSSLAKGARVINFDKRGTGLSDRISGVPDFEDRMDDIRAVLDAAGSERATLFGWGEGAALAALFAATHPERAAGLILSGGNARMTWAADYPWGMTEDVWTREHARIPQIWGREKFGREWAEMSFLLGSNEPDDPELFRWAAKWARYSAAPGDMLAFDRVLATVLFTDIVDSTSQSAAMGDQAWGKVQDAHDQIVRAQLARFRGREIRTMGDGFLATFDGPARAVRCAQSITAAVRPLGIEIRAGLHTGEIELVGDDISGLAVAIGARVGALAGASQILVSSTVRDLVVGSDINLEDRGLHSLKGVPGEWQLYEVGRNQAL
jgi:class 3 adenylate cyclase